MRASHPGGRFSIFYETDSIERGIDADLQNPVGQEVSWYRWDPALSEPDPVYDVGSTSGARVWRTPFKVPVIVAKVFQGVSMQNDRGMYNTDVLRLTINLKDVRERLVGLEKSPDQFIRDRIVFEKSAYSPNRMFLTGRVLSKFTVLVVDAEQVMPDQMVNDVQFQNLLPLT